MSNYHVLYRKDADYPYLVIVYVDLVNSPRTTPNEFYAFHEQTCSKISKNSHAPIKVYNIYGSDLYTGYLNRGWTDITQSDNFIPGYIKDWLVQNSS